MSNFDWSDFIGKLFANLIMLLVSAFVAKVMWNWTVADLIGVPHIDFAQSFASLTLVQVVAFNCRKH